LGQLLLVVAAVVVLAIATHTTDLLIVIVALVIMVMLHELGHFATAKWGHMKVTEYFFGFGPRIWSVRRGETEYGIKAIPAGGYVKILGMTNTEQVDPADEARTYRQRPFHNRLLVAVAGSAMHGVMAFALIWGLLVFIGTHASTLVAITAFSPITHNSDPARAAGLHVGDVIARVDGRKITTTTQLVNAISAHPGKPLEMLVDRGGHLLSIGVAPHVSAGSSVRCPGGHAACIGIEIGAATERTGPLAALGSSGIDLGRTITGTVSALGQTFSAHGISTYIHALTSSKAANNLAKSGKRPQSIVGAVRYATQAAQAGAGDLIAVLVSIIVIIGMLNLLPMLPLDGGHVAIAVYERIRSRRGRPYHADVMKLMPVAYAFVLFLGFIVVSSMYLDITHPVVNPFQ